MTFDIALVLVILVAALVALVTERIPMDLVALLVLTALALTGLVTPVQAFAGFSNPAVITVWAMFILSAGLTRAGVADMLGRRVLRMAGNSEARQIVVIVLTSGVLSAFMNNIGVAALMLPVVVNVARRTGVPPSRLLMPLAYGCLLGGLTTLIGTPPNLLIAEALHARDLRPFGMFDFFPTGGAAMFAGALFLAGVGRHLLPRRDPAREASTQSADLDERYRLSDWSAVIQLPADSDLAGKTLAQSRLGSATGLNVYAVLRDDETRLAPEAAFALRAGDRLLVEGELDRFRDLREWKGLELEPGDSGLDVVASERIALVELAIPEGSSIVGSTLRDLKFRSRFGGIVLALRRADGVRDRGLAMQALAAGDRLLVQTRRSDVHRLRVDATFAPGDTGDERALTETYGLTDRIFTVRIPGGSHLAERSLSDSRVGDALGLGVLGFIRDGNTHLLPEPDELLREGDRLLVRGTRDDLTTFRGLQTLVIDSGTAPQLQRLQSDGEGLIEAMLSPRTTLAGKTPLDIRFRERFGLQVLALLREGKTIYANLRDTPLRFGDALLLLGPKDRAELLSREADFLVLSELPPAEATAPRKAPLATLIMAAVVLSVLFGLFPIAVAGVAGAAIMVLTGCLGMSDAYRAIEWRSIFLIAGMLPLGTAMADTGAAGFVASGMVGTLGFLGPWGAILSLYLVTAAATCIVPTAALVVLMAPVVVTTCAEMDFSVHTAMMAVAMAASASFTSPVSHPANLMVMGPGGYRFADYVRLGVPLTLVVMVVVLVLLPLFWPLHG